MKKFLCSLLVLIFVMLPASAGMVLEGNVSYTEETAREEAFLGVEQKISMDKFKSEIKDKNYIENKKALKSGRVFSDRIIQYFKIGAVKAYAITYLSKPQYTYYYSTLINNLLFLDISEDGIEDFPYKVIRYSYNGDLLAVGFYVSEDERFLFDKDRNLLSHWIGKEGFNKKGKKIGEIENISD